MNAVVWNVNGVPGRTDYAYVPHSDLLAGMTTARTGGVYTAVTADYTYEPYRDVKTQVLNRAGVRVISQYDYRYNETGNRTSVVNSGEAFAGREGFNLYQYNSRSEVTESKRFRGTDLNDTSRPVLPEYRSYNYDPIGNRTDAVEGNETQQDGKSTAYATNGLNQYETTAVTPQTNESATFTYDADGNMTSVADSTGYTLYVFDGENRLVEVRPNSPQPSQKKVDFAYDFMGRRIKKDVYIWNNGAWVMDTASTFTWDGWLMIDETATPNGGQPDTMNYVWGLDLSQTLQGAGGTGGLLANFYNTTTYNCYDGNGNCLQFIKETDCLVAASYQTDLYWSSINFNEDADIENCFKFSTKYTDVEINMIYYGYRYFSSELGRWLSKDPSSNIGEPNLYLFIMNNPACWYDILGLRRSEEYDEYYKVDGSLSWRNNNPGNIIYGAWARAHGATGASQSSKRFAKFPTEQGGMDALKELLRSSQYSDLTVMDAIKRYAPSEDQNNPEQYVETLRGMGLDPEGKVSEQVDALAAAIKRVEGWREGTIEKKCPEKKAAK